jgi:hypothetical protein
MLKIYEFLNFCTHTYMYNSNTPTELILFTFFRIGPLSDSQTISKNFFLRHKKIGRGSLRNGVMTREHHPRFVDFSEKRRSQSKAYLQYIHVHIHDFHVVWHRAEADNVTWDLPAELGSILIFNASTVWQSPTMPDLMGKRPCRPMPFDNQIIFLVPKYPFLDRVGMYIKDLLYNHADHE